MTDQEIRNVLHEINFDLLEEWMMLIGAHQDVDDKTFYYWDDIDNRILWLHQEMMCPVKMENT